MTQYGHHVPSVPACSHLSRDFDAPGQRTGQQDQRSADPVRDPGVGVPAGKGRILGTCGADRDPPPRDLDSVDVGRFCHRHQVGKHPLHQRRRPVALQEQCAEPAQPTDGVELGQDRQPSRDECAFGLAHTITHEVGHGPLKPLAVRT